MKKQIKYNYNGIDKLYVYEFTTINEFYKFISERETKEGFCKKGREASKSSGTPGWYGTKNWEECIDLLKNGWEDGGKTITQKLKDVSKVDCKDTVVKQLFDVVGFQASVPRYLQGIPTSMINQKRVVQKQKVVTISKSVAFTANFTANDIIEESVKCLRIIKKIEAQGIRCNLNIINITKNFSGEAICVKVRIKNANERLNIGKLAFLVAHPSVKRRLLFRFVEVFDETNRSWFPDYGVSVMDKKSLDKYAEKGEIILPSVVDVDVETQDVDSLVAGV